MMKVVGIAPDVRPVEAKRAVLGGIKLQRRSIEGASLHQKNRAQEHGVFRESDSGRCFVRSGLCWPCELLPVVGGLVADEAGRGVPKSHDGSAARPRT